MKGYCTNTFLDRKNISHWMNDRRTERGYTILNAKYKPKINALKFEFAKRSSILFYLITVMNMNNLRKLFISVNKQKDFIAAVQLKLKDKKITPEWVDAFDRDINGMNKRIATIDKTIDININLTEFYPFFKEFDIVEYLVDDDNYKETEVIKNAWDNWKANNQDKIDAHMESTMKEREAIEAERKRNNEMADAERKLLKEARKAANAEVREIKKNQKMSRSERELERSFKRLYKEADKYWNG